MNQWMTSYIEVWTRFDDAVEYSGRQRIKSDFGLERLMNIDLAI
ncbi:hypothetical protein SAMN05444370_111103 [Rubrimonas cliftonensis]|uniref:Uncharacterized protein n=1 Tax=Rubrimonas cliftonensis TaxID=89524 RepID=A0A1H4DY41_9RHOB|nr:hypothetical protein SAMN05444370_111103 [Rubrimonas cliftonensis]